jgi:hypothetical protein
LGKLKREGTKREKIAKGSPEKKAKGMKEEKVYVVVQPSELERVKIIHQGGRKIKGRYNHEHRLLDVSREVKEGMEGKKQKKQKS